MQDATSSNAASFLRELTTAEVIGAAFRLYRDHLASLVLIALIPHFIILVLELLLSGAGVEPPLEVAALLSATVVLNAVLLAAMTRAIGTAVLGGAPGVAESYRGTLSRSLASILAAYLLVAILATAGFLLFVIPGLVIGGLLLPTVPAIVLEGRTALPALARAFGLMRPSVARATAVFSFVILVSAVLPLGILLLIPLGPFSPLLSAILGAATLPLAYSANVVLYLSARSREGYVARDLSRELEALRAESQV
jgi:hypothetical protein